MDKQSVDEIRRLPAGTSVEGSVQVARKAVKTTRQGKPYLDLILRDRTGEVTARIWDDAEAVSERFKEGDAVAFTGIVEHYQGQPQLKVLPESFVQLPDSDRAPDEFLPVTPKDRAELARDLDALIESVTQAPLRALLDAMLHTDESLRAAFEAAPAALRVHQPYLGGLIEHSLNVARICDHLCTLYPTLHRDLLITCAILHDIGKTREYAYERMLDHTDEGRLIGHLTIGYTMVRDAIAAIEGFPPDLALHIEHILLGHHGQLIFGSPVPPMTPEAVALHYAENLDAKTATFIAIREKGGDTNWSEYLRYLDPARQVFLLEPVAEAPAADEGQTTEG